MFFANFRRPERLLFSFTFFVAALGASSNNASSVFVLDGNGGGNYTFALNIPDNSTNLYFHLSSPVGNSWIGVGIGEEMKDALVFIAYLNADGNNVTLSPRLAMGHTEPVYTSDIKVDLLEGSGITNNTFVVNAICYNCTAWKLGSMDMSSPSQPFIYALGPNINLNSNSLSANLRVHSDYGKFTMNIPQATGPGGVPTVLDVMTGASQIGKNDTYNNWSMAAHAVFMIFAFVGLFPGGVIFLRVFGTVTLHWLVQALGAIFVFIGFFIGIYLSTMYNKSKHFNSYHQVMGILLVVGIVGQFTLGFLHHRRFKRITAEAKTAAAEDPVNAPPMAPARTIITRIHLGLGPLIMLLGIINAGVGFNWTPGGSEHYTAYIAVCVVVALGFFTLYMTRLWWNRRRARKAQEKAEAEAQTQPAAGEQYGGYAQSQGWQGGNPNNGYPYAPQSWQGQIEMQAQGHPGAAY